MAINYLLSTDDLKKKGLIHQNTDTKLLSRAIQIVQDRELQPLLGSILYRELLSRVETNTWDADYTELMDDYVVPCLVAMVDAQVVTIGTNKITNKGVGKTTDENFNPNNSQDNALFRDELRKIAEFYKARLIGLLCDDDGQKYPEYEEGITRTAHDQKPNKKAYSVPWISTTQHNRPFKDCNQNEIDEY